MESSIPLNTRIQILLLFSAIIVSFKYVRQRISENRNLFENNESDIYGADKVQIFILKNTLYTFDYDTYSIHII